MSRHHLYLVPGMFGFGQLAGYDYFNHVRAAIESRFAHRGLSCQIEVVPTPPTSSLRHRARILLRTVEKTLPEDGGPIHLVGHSTGGLDVRLVLAPGSNLEVDPRRLAWTARVTSAVSLNTPHFGTPLASYFSTVSGTRALYLLSLFTIMSLSLGEPSLAIFSRVLAGIGGVDRIFGGDLKVISRVTDMILRFVDRQGRADIKEYLDKVRGDQGGIIQIMPEAMDLFNASTEANPKVRYGCIAAAAPTPRTLKLALRVRSPYSAMTAAMFSTLYRFTSQRHAMYPYARPDGQQAELLSLLLGSAATDSANDGVVPTLSMLYGRLLWCGQADHLDVLGHFADDARPRLHTDWVTSGASFGREAFGHAMDAIVRFQLGE